MLPVFGWPQTSNYEHFCETKQKEKDIANKICGYIPLLGSCIGMIRVIGALDVLLSHNKKMAKLFQMAHPFQTLLRGILELFCLGLFLAFIDWAYTFFNKDQETDYNDSDSDSSGESKCES